MTFTKDEHYNVTVTKIMERGAVVTISGSDRTAFIHISQISKSFVQNIAEFLEVGKTYDAICTDPDRPSFSLHHLKLRSLYKVEGDRKSDQRDSGRQHGPMSLDDMIARANASLADKQKHSKVPSRQMHNSRRKRGKVTEDYD